MTADGFVLGYDPSLTSFGCGRVWDDGSITTYSWSPSSKGMERLEEFLELVEFDLAGDPRPQLVVLEDYAFSRGHQAHAKGELGGVVRMALWDSGIPTIVVPPSVLKKFVTGKGNAQKDVMRLEAYKRFGIEAASEDEVEAACLAVLGWHWLGMGEGRLGIRMKVPKAHLESLEKIKELE